MELINMGSWFREFDAKLPWANFFKYICIERSEVLYSLVLERYSCHMGV
jgi:hypothetical protein